MFCFCVCRMAAGAISHEIIHGLNDKGVKTLSGLDTFPLDAVVSKRRRLDVVAEGGQNNLPLDLNSSFLTPGFSSPDYTFPLPVEPNEAIVRGSARWRYTGQFKIMTASAPNVTMDNPTRFCVAADLAIGGGAAIRDIVLRAGTAVGPNQNWFSSLWQTCVQGIDDTINKDVPVFDSPDKSQMQNAWIFQAFMNAQTRDTSTKAYSDSPLFSNDFIPATLPATGAFPAAANTLANVISEVVVHPFNCPTNLLASDIATAASAIAGNELTTFPPGVSVTLRLSPSSVARRQQVGVVEVVTTAPTAGAVAVTTDLPLFFQLTSAVMEYEVVSTEPPNKDSPDLYLVPISDFGLERIPITVGNTSINNTLANLYGASTPIPDWMCVFLNSSNFLTPGCASATAAANLQPITNPQASLTGLHAGAVNAGTSNLFTQQVLRLNNDIFYSCMAWSTTLQFDGTATSKQWNKDHFLRSARGQWPQLLQPTKMEADALSNTFTWGDDCLFYRTNPQNSCARNTLGPSLSGVVSVTGTLGGAGAPNNVSLFVVTIAAKQLVFQKVQHGDEWYYSYRPSESGRVLAGLLENLLRVDEDKAAALAADPSRLTAAAA